MKFSVVVPTYNEERDIADTLDHLLLLDGHEVEILVVDDSTDHTPEIVAGYAHRGVRLLRPPKPEGRCGARNLGIREASGDVVVILNADVHLPRDFVDRICAHYRAGADYVLVRSTVENMDDLFARYVECVGRVDMGKSDPDWMEWTEGFSCRREIAMRAGLFPVGFPVPICAGEDGYFGTNLRKAGARKVMDFSIVVTHVAPAAFREYWRIRVGRGRGSPQVRRFLEHWPMSRIVAWAALRVLKNVLQVALVLPVLVIGYRIARESPHGTRDWLAFCYAWLIEQIAFHVGEWRSIFEIRRAEGIARADRG